MVHDMQAADSAMASSAASLKKLRDAHSKLLQAFGKDASGLDAAIRALRAEAAHAQSFYKDLAK